MIFSTYHACPGLHVVMLTPQRAEAHERRVMGIPADVTLGWTPYTILVRSHGGTLPYVAFTEMAAFRRWLKRRDIRLKLTGRGRGLRYGVTVAANTLPRRLP